MFSKISVSRVFSVLLVVLLLSGTASARPLNAALGTGFTYQGKLTDGGAPANGTCDFQFGLYDALSVGTQLGSTQTVSSVSVSNGLFTVTLNSGGEFGASAFDGNARYLEIAVRCPAGSGGYTTLNPRQQLSPTPYAIYAAKAPWSGLSGVPASFADGVDDNTTYTAGDGLELVGTQFKGKGTPYQNMVIVAQSGGDFTTITAALASILDASPTNPYLIYVAPGVYTESVTMKPFVDIEGAGELTTKITYTGSAELYTGTVVGANSAELRFLTVENTGGGAWAVAIYNSGASPRLTHVTVSASGGTINNYGVYNSSSSSPAMTNVTANASGGTNSYGVYNNSYSSPTMTNVTASASGETNSYGVYNYSFSSPTMTNVTASASGGAYNSGVYNYHYSSPAMTNVSASASASGGFRFSYGVYNSSSSSPTMTNVSASASGGMYDSCYGVYNNMSSPTINNSVIRASGGGGNIGIYNITSGGGGPYIVLVNNSQVSGSGYTIYNDPLFTTRVGASQLSGGAVTGGGTVTCAGVYDEVYTFFAGPACPP